jgi:betaine-aldehyde dehydrogenase
MDTIYDEFHEAFRERATKIVVAPGDREGAEMGPLVSEAHMNRVLSYIETGRKEGAKAASLRGYMITRRGMLEGFFVAPTIFGDCTPGMKIVQERSSDP